MRICEAAVQILRETNNSSVMHGDGHLLHLIANRAGIKSDGWKTEIRVLNSLSKQPGDLQKGLVGMGQGNRRVRIFRMEKKP